MERVLPSHHDSTDYKQSLVNDPQQTPQTRHLSTKLCSALSSLQATPPSTPLRSAKIAQRSVEGRRKRTRQTQARYRQKLQDKPKQLEVAIKQLKEQVQHLECERSQILGCISTTSSVWMAAVEYFRIFRRGCHAPQGTNIVDMDILKALIASDVAFSGGIGLDALVHHWGVFTQYFSDVGIRLKNLQQITNESVLATTTTTITMTEASITTAFPHLTSGMAGKSVAAKLKDERLVLHGSVRFHWDNTINRVISIQAHADMVTPLVQLLGNLKDASLVFTNALVNVECNLVVQGCFIV
ncbi:hypothetical protein PC129_g14486 [Phytophthora cactorum]|uniref:BZIP domain-containing protein n=1 Tax=Phytophthora cactorum TaxID=29920 RepID=A0A329SMG4_9STRA|nr:hypothetical protein Pcac1_g15051 [Phytophthora cactorum]KAG2810344.1 hypothetical protein PC112_g16090 [Phytophthora cactorum]KAG2811701.1 hypothetical protein PC111_g15124 [Phytophthora cactorum]KAG2851510.1 hypothetical protein PC113_g15836 [Phytophthora cactorum]KAG2899071.1 hypothetical protein PC114_g14027 [Phytophthora cactorum]